MGRDRFKPDPDDFVIVIMGPTGSGKSNFINHLTGATERPKASYLKSDTKDVTPYPISYHDLRLVLVDTPGFDDTHRPDSVILRAIADWLVQKYPDGTTLKIAGIIYLHRITDNRMSGSAFKNLELFGSLCGDLSLGRTRLVTTMWDSAKDKAMAKQREAQLTGEFWRKLTEGGAVAKRFYNSRASALDIIHGLLNVGKGELLLQEELVVQQKRLNETEAGKVLYSRLQKLLAGQKKMLKELAEARLQSDPASAKALQEEYDKVDAQLRKTFEETKEMKIPFFRQVQLWFFGRKTNAQAVELDPPA